MHINKDRLDAFMHEGFARGVMNGTYLLAQNGEIVTEGALGIADLASGRKLDIDTIFELASVSKQFTATATLLLRDRSLLSLDDPLERFFPGIPYSGRTIRHLLNHTSGLPDYMEWVGSQAGSQIPGNEIIERFIFESGLPEIFAPGEKWSYCNTGYCLLALIIEKASGVSFAEFLGDNLFQPAGLESTCVYHRRKNGNTINNYAFGYIWENDGWILPDASPSNNYVIPLDGVEGDGTVNTTLHDLLRWDWALKSGMVLSHASQAEMYTATTLKDGSQNSYGLGWFVDGGVDNRCVHHRGDWPGYRTLFARWLDRGTTLILLTNQSGYDTYGTESLFEGVIKIAGGDEIPNLRLFNDLVDHGYEKSRFGLFTGEYEQGAKVECEGDQLFITIKAEVLPIGNDVFIPRNQPIPIKFSLDGHSIHFSIGTVPIKLIRIE
jgi:CubicO group peptidase (beta-lactamase class C family)